MYHLKNALEIILALIVGALLLPIYLIVIVIVCIAGFTSELWAFITKPYHIIKRKLEDRKRAENE